MWKIEVVGTKVHKVFTITEKAQIRSAGGFKNQSLKDISVGDPILHLLLP